MARTDFGFFALALVGALSLLALTFGLAPAFFCRVDHPLHSLDRCRLICGLGSCLLLFLFLGINKGPRYQRSQKNLGQMGQLFSGMEMSDSENLGVKTTHVQNW
jgi:hypothetical protein